jgi:hypothetical protein
LQEENKNMKERIASGENTEEYSKNGRFIYSILMHKIF